MEEPQTSTTTTTLRVRVLDGGTGEELLLRKAIDEPLIWSASALKHEGRHKAVKEVHADFLRAGAEFVTTNNYAARPGLGFDRQQVRDLTGVAARLALEAVNQVAAEGRPRASILGCLPPLVESFRPDLVMPHDDGVEWYKLILEALRPAADIWLAETMSSSKEVNMVVEAVGKLPADARKPLWVALSLQSDGCLRSGEHAQDVIDAACRLAASTGTGIEAILFNCCEPEAISLALRSLKVPDGLALGAYPNLFVPIPKDWEIKDAEGHGLRSDLPLESFVSSFVEPWLQQGVSIIGGCCGTTPAHIAAITAAVERRHGTQPEAAAAQPTAQPTDRAVTD